MAILQQRVLLLGERVRAACVEKLASFCGAEAVQIDLPAPPQMHEPLLSNLPLPPTEPQEFTQWAQSLVELSEQRGREAGFRAGEEKGLREGEARGKAEAILRILSARRLQITEEQRRVVLTCCDQAQLGRWLDAAVTAPNADALFEKGEGS